MAITREQELVELGQDCFQKRDFKRAINFFSEVIEINPQNVDALFNLANIFYGQGQIKKSIKAFKRVLEIDSEHVEASIGLSVLLNDIGRYQEAEIIFEKINGQVKKYNSRDFNDPHINKKFAFKHFELAELYLTYNRYDEALFEYNKAIGLNPSDLDARVKMAKVYAKKGMVSKSLDELQKIKAEEPHFLPARVAIGVLHYGNGHILEAQNEWQRVLARDSENPEAKMYLHLSEEATETSVPQM